MADSRKSTVLVGGRRSALEDLAKVAVLGYTVELDPSALAKMDESASKAAEGQLVTSFDSSSSSENGLGVSERRAVLFARLVGLMQGKSQVRSVVCTAMADMLNDGSNEKLPHFVSEQTAGAALVQAVIAAVPTGLSRGEVETLQNGEMFMKGLCALGASALVNLVAMFDCAAALSCEARESPVFPFDAAFFDLDRPHRGMITSSTNLRHLLEGSKSVSNPDANAPQIPDCFRCIPQYHGPAVDAAIVCSKSMEIELNSVENGVVKAAGNALGAYDPQQSYLAFTNAVRSLESVVESSNLRCELLGSKSEFLPLHADDDCKLARVRGCLEFLAFAQAQLATELEISIRALDRKEEQARQAAREKEERAAKNVQAQSHQEESLEGLSEEKRAKIEAKRKAKAEKEAAKAAKKKQSKGIVLGAGTQELKQFLAHKPLTAPVAWDYSADSLNTFVPALLERLGSGGTRRKVKIPKGTRDYLPEQMRVREQAFATIRRVFKRHGAVEIDTPVFELKETLTGKYGEDSKLIYDLADQGGELLALRYDLTVPFARFLALHSVGNIKRYHIAKVYRRDNPALARGRYREFYQCDFDIAGTYPPLVADSEVLTVACEILSELPIGPFMIKLNHRRLLDAIFDLCGVPAEKFRPICSAVDKLDKESWETVRREMVEDKGLAGEIADRIGTFVVRKGSPLELHAQLMAENVFEGHTEALAAMDELRILFNYLGATNVLQYISFDLSLARGLDYYTGAIYEAVITDGTSVVGSIAAGGRYDKLVGMFSPQDVPCVGVSIGVERVFTLMEARAQAAGVMQQANVQVFVASVGNNLLAKRMAVCKQLWEHNIAAEYSYQENPKLKKQMDTVLERGIPFMVIVGEDELAQGMVKVKDMEARTEDTVPLVDLASVILDKGCPAVPAGVDLSILERMRGIRIAEQA